MSLKRAMLISTFAIASITSQIGCVSCNAMKEELKLAYMNSKCDDGKCEKEKDDTEKKEETEKLADEKEKAKQQSGRAALIALMLRIFRLKFFNWNFHINFVEVLIFLYVF